MFTLAGIKLIHSNVWYCRAAAIAHHHTLQYIGALFAREIFNPRIHIFEKHLKAKADLDKLDDDHRKYENYYWNPMAKQHNFYHHFIFNMGGATNMFHVWSCATDARTAEEKLL